jgi:hypothetical protein
MDLHRMRVLAIAFCAVALVLTGVGIVLVNADQTDGPGWVDAGSAKGLAERGVTYVHAAKAYVIDTPGGLVALSARSPHVGERITYCGRSGWFEESTGGSMFDSTGRYVFGPSPLGMSRFDIHVVGGEVWIDTTNRYLGPPRGAHDDEPAGPYCR